MTDQEIMAEIAECRAARARFKELDKQAADLELKSLAEVKAIRAERDRAYATWETHRTAVGLDWS